jgi:hypothetical protein
MMVLVALLLSQDAAFPADQPETKPNPNFSPPNGVRRRPSLSVTARLLSFRSVQQELDLTGEQLEAFNRITGAGPKDDRSLSRDELQEQRARQATEQQEQIERFLTEDQRKRLAQIRFQDLYPESVMNADKELEISPEQMESIQKALREAGISDKLDSLRRFGPNSGTPEQEARLEKANREYEAIVLDQLFSAQRDKLEALKGAPFDFTEIRKRRSSAPLDVLGRPEFGVAGRFNTIPLLRNAVVQEELKLDDEQKREIADVVQQFREDVYKVHMGQAGFPGELTRETAQAQLKLRMESLATLCLETEDELAKAKELSEDQLKRLCEIAFQARGLDAFEHPETQAALAMNADQIAAVTKARQTYLARLREWRTAQRNDAERPANTAAAEGPDTLKSRRADAIQSILTDEQKQKVATLRGADFDLARLRAVGRPSSSSFAP